MKIRSFFSQLCDVGIISELYLFYEYNFKVFQMQEINKVTIDLIFCLIIGFLIIQASNSAKQNEQLSNSLSLESARISAETLR